ncbi:Lysosomal alpha-mannosidase [Thelohanellus kitauei]|uniref:Lysosomal alpha-mannosidase n=1 Tax=Thelohanellus kitauei TaxID=669202 RepID=A0A0C2IVG2_THEKT|nr:Lysosomal alpha-mannosidase [Thelohanellus kitauei]
MENIHGRKQSLKYLCLQYAQSQIRMKLVLLVCYFLFKTSRTLNIHFVVHMELFNITLLEDQGLAASKKEKTQLSKTIDSIVQALGKNPTRIFVLSSAFFFAEWYESLTPQEKETAKNLFEKKQLGFATGAWMPNDETITDYLNLIDQTADGLDYIKSVLGEKFRPRVAFLPSFGHSLGYAPILQAMDHNLVIISKISYDEAKKLESDRELEVYLKVQNLAPQTSQSSIPGILQTRTNFKLKQACQEKACSNQPISQRLSDNDLAKVSGMVMDYIQSYSGIYKSADILIPIEIDANPQSVEGSFMDIEKIMESIRKDGKYQPFYSSFEKYSETVLKELSDLPIREKDFLPYLPSTKMAYTGYYSTRMLMKKAIRIRTGFLRVCKQFSSFDANQDIQKVNKLRNKLNFATHYFFATSAITKKAYFSFQSEIKLASQGCLDIMSDVYSKRLQMESPFLICDKLDFGVCSIGQEDKFYMIIYNPTANKKTYTQVLPVSGSYYHVKDPFAVITPVIANPKLKIKGLDKPYGALKNIILFRVNLGAFQTNVYTISKADAAEIPQQLISRKTEKYYFFENDYYKTMFRLEARDFAWLALKKGPEIKNISVSISYNIYQSKTASEPFSGKLSFQPLGSEASRCNPSALTSPCVVYPSKDNKHTRIICDEGSRCQSEIIFEESSPAIRLRYYVGPLQDATSTEAFIKWETNISSGNIFYTDVNGRSMVKRTIDPSLRMDIGRNYYPIVKRIFINDTSAQLNIFTDQSLGGTSLNSGQMELMLHRRLVKPDTSVDGENLDDIDPVTNKGEVTFGDLWMMISDSDNEHLVVETQYLLQNPPVFGFTTKVKTKLLKFLTPNENVLPKGIHVLSFERYTRDDFTHLFRFENIYPTFIKAPEEEKFDLVKFISPFKLIRLEERILSADKPLQSTGKYDINCKTGECKSSVIVYIMRNQIRTFLVKLST